MASPIFHHLRKALSPRLPAMRFKSPFKIKQLDAKLSVPEKDPEYINTKIHFQDLSPCRRQLFKDGASFHKTRTPKMCYPLAFEPNIKDILDNGIDEKQYYVLGKGTFGVVILSCLRGDSFYFFYIIVMLYEIVLHIFSTNLFILFEKYKNFMYVFK